MGGENNKKMCIVHVGMLGVCLLSICVFLFPNKDKVIIKLVPGAQKQFPSGNRQNFDLKFSLLVNLSSVTAYFVKNNVFVFVIVL